MTTEEDIDKDWDASFVSPKVVPYLEKWVKDLVADWLERNKNQDGTGDADWDMNDIVIFNDFVLPVIQEARGKGFRAEDMLHKGSGFLMANMHSVVAETVPPEDHEARGELIKLGYAYECGQILERCGIAPAKYVSENQASFKFHIDALARLNALR